MLMVKKLKKFGTLHEFACHPCACPYVCASTNLEHLEQLEQNWNNGSRDCSKFVPKRNIGTIGTIEVQRMRVSWLDLLCSCTLRVMKRELVFNKTV